MFKSEQTVREEKTPQKEPTTEAHPMDLLLGEGAFEVETPRRGEIRKGVVARLGEKDLLIDIGAKSEGVVPIQELDQLPAEKREALAVGEEVMVYVLRSDERDGMFMLSLLKAEEQKDWEVAEELLASEENYEASIDGYNKGGLIVKLGRLRGFVPASQVSLARRRRAGGDTPEERWGDMLDESVVVKVIEVDRQRNRLILSEREASKEARDRVKEQLIADLEPGEVRTGHVISLADFGAFVDIGGADGLIHTSELSWKRVDHPGDLLEVGQEIEVKVLDLDPERNRISLSLRELEDDPWDEIAERFQEGMLVEGIVTKLTKFGAFARLAETDEYEVEGLIHISELAERRIEHPSEVVREGETVTLRIINVEAERRRIGLSLRKADSKEYAESDWEAALEDLDEEAAKDFDEERAGEDPGGAAEE